MALDWRRLVAVERVVRRRRGEARPFFLRSVVLGPAAIAVATCGLAALPPATAERAWLLAVLGAAGLVVGGAPFRMFWRPDSGFLGRLPIEGSELYRLESWRALGVAAWLAAALAVASLGLGLGGDPLAVARHVAFAAALLAAGAALAPAAGTLGGSMVVSARTQAVVQGATGQSAPPSTFLSLVPAFGAGALLAAAYVSSPWLATGLPRALVPLASAVAVALVGYLAARPLARRMLATVTREVAALDAVKLAHVDLVRARGLERWLGRLLGRPGRLVYEKDVALMRRRHPGYYLLTGLGVIGLWITAFAVDEPTRDLVAVIGVVLLGAYDLVFARRLATPPVEGPRYLRTLPIAPGEVAAAKRLAVAGRAF